MKHYLKLAAPLLLLIPAAANATTYSDRATFNTAVTGVVNNDLESLPVGPVSTVFGVETIASGAGGDAQISTYSSGTFGHALGGGGAQGAFDSVVFDFTAPIFAFGFDDLDLTGANSEFANISITLQGGATSLFSVSETDSDFSTAAFFGFASGTAIQSVRIWSSDAAGGDVGTRANLVDNLAISRIAQGGGVPEPSTWALVIVGFGLTGSLLRRNRASQAVA